MSTHLRLLSESYQMNANMIVFDDFQKTLHPCPLGESSLSIGRVKRKRFECDEISFVPADEDTLEEDEYVDSLNVHKASYSRKLRLLFVQTTVA